MQTYALKQGKRRGGLVFSSLRFLFPRRKTGMSPALTAVRSLETRARSVDNTHVSLNKRPHKTLLSPELAATCRHPETLRMNTAQKSDNVCTRGRWERTARITCFCRGILPRCLFRWRCLQWRTRPVRACPLSPARTGLDELPRSHPNDVLIRQERGDTVALEQRTCCT